MVCSNLKINVFNLLFDQTTDLNCQRKSSLKKMLYKATKQRSIILPNRKQLHSIPRFEIT